MRNNYKFLGYFLMIFICFTFVLGIMEGNINVVKTSANGSENFSNLSNKKICWGIKRSSDHKQPDLGNENKRIMNSFNGLCLGNPEKKFLYLTFDAGYEAGYTEKILEVLKQNNVKATFFITGHYLNSQPDLVKKMIENGNTVGNHAPKFLMSRVVA